MVYLSVIPSTELFSFKKTEAFLLVYFMLDYEYQAATHFSGIRKTSINFCYALKVLSRIFRLSEFSSYIGKVYVNAIRTMISL